MPKIMRNGIAYGKGGKKIVHNGVAYGGSHVAKLVEKTITANGTYDASDDGVDGYSLVTVNTPLPNNVDVFTTENINWGKRLTSSGYLEGSDNNNYVAGYFNLEGYSKVHILRPLSTRICFYDANKNFVSSSTPFVNGIMDIPNGAKYIRFDSSDDYTNPSVAKEHAACILSYD